MLFRALLSIKQENFKIIDKIVRNFDSKLSKSVIDMACKGHGKGNAFDAGNVQRLSEGDELVGRDIIDARGKLFNRARQHARHIELVNELKDWIVVNRLKSKVVCEIPAHGVANLISNNIARPQGHNAHLILIFPHVIGSNLVHFDHIKKLWILQGRLERTVLAKKNGVVGKGAIDMKGAQDDKFLHFKAQAHFQYSICAHDT